MVVAWFVLGLGDVPDVLEWSRPRVVETALAADTLKIDGLSKDSKQFRAQVEQLLKKTDVLIARLRTNPAFQTVVLDLLQTHDDILRELPKIDSAPGDARWTAKEMFESVQSKLKLLKDQYDKA
jgi:hypothetical protein